MNCFFYFIILFKVKKDLKKKILFNIYKKQMLKAKRVKNQLEQIRSNPPQRWKIIQVNQSTWDCWITCDSSCPFYGVPFLLKIQFPQNYPMSRPQFTLNDFKKFYHPNISNGNGSICHKVVNSDQMIRVRQRIQGFINLLQFANPHSALNGDAAKMYDSDKKSYYRKARLVFKGEMNQ